MYTLTKQRTQSSTPLLTVALFFLHFVSLMGDKNGVHYGFNYIIILIDIFSCVY